MKIEIKQDVALAGLTTFKTGGMAQYFVEVGKTEDLIEALKWAKNNPPAGGLPFFILGGGSNLLVNDNGYNGLVLKLTTTNYKLQINSNSIVADAGVSLRQLIDFSLEQGLSGLEWANGIPRITLGGAVYGNAGAFNKRMSDIVKEVRVLDYDNFEVKTLENKDCHFDYKETIFKKNKNLIILSAVLEMEQKNQTEIKRETERVLEYRISHHPMELPSAGSIFKNVKVDSNEGGKILSKCDESVCDDFKKRGEIPAAWIIEQCGLKGKQIGKAMISEKHSNFIVNLGGALSSDIKALIDLVKQTSKEKFGFSLVEEVQYLGF